MDRVILEDKFEVMFRINFVVNSVNKVMCYVGNKLIKSLLDKLKVPNEKVR